MKSADSIFVRHVDRLYGMGIEREQPLFTPRCHANCPSAFYQQSGYFAPDAR